MSTQGIVDGGTQPAVVRLRRSDSLSRFHPWIFSGALADVPEGVEEGDVVAIASPDGSRLLGHGHFQIGSIAVRVLSFDPDEPIDEAFFANRLAQAARLRHDMGLPSAATDAYRLVHGEGDFLPGLIIDVYADTAVVQAHSPGMHFARHIIAGCLTELLPSVRNVYYKSETTLPYKAQLDPQNDYLAGGYSDNLATENGLRFHIDWLKGQKTGFFVDQRDNRMLVERWAKGRSVLNMFCYTGGFSVYALRGGAREVVSVDSSAKAIALTDANVALNFADAAAEGRHRSEAVDAFRYLDKLARGAHDLIILDPPAFAKHQKALANALRGYQRLNARAIEAVAPGGLVFTFSCSQAVSREKFRLAVFSAAAQTGRRVRILHQMSQPADHPVNIYHPEGEYLKGLVLQVE